MFAGFFVPSVAAWVFVGYVGLALLKEIAMNDPIVISGDTTMKQSTLSALSAVSFDVFDAPPMRGYSYPADRGRPSGVRKAKRAVQKWRNVRARSRK